jgi:hypothetical protein
MIPPEKLYIIKNAFFERGRPWGREAKVSSLMVARPRTSSGLVGIIELTTRWRSARTSQRPDQRRRAGWGKGRRLPAQARPGYALHN